MPLTRSILCLCAAVCFLSAVDAAKNPTGQKNLALNKPASASSIENDDQNAAKANDGNDDTQWCADDEPENGAEWWQVDLQKPADLSGCEITWPYDDKQYRCKVEGSSDNKTWTMLSDQSKTTSRSRVQKLKFENAVGIRYVKITIISFDPGCWASISEVKVFGKQ
jgi:alpha-L-fucosidase